MSKLARQNLLAARNKWPGLTDSSCIQVLKQLTDEYQFSVRRGDLLLMDSGWYVTHAGLLRLARRHRCVGIDVEPVLEFSDPTKLRWAFKATVYRTKHCRGFVGYGDADPSNVSPLVHGAELRAAETRSVSRALRKAYGIGICSVEEIGSLAVQPASSPASKKIPQPSNGNGNYGGRTVRDRLCQLIRQHQLDAALVKLHATNFCGVATLRDATRAQVENFVPHLADWAEKDRNALLCQLNSYLVQKEGAA
jgi:hypothetical protein